MSARSAHFIILATALAATLAHAESCPPGPFNPGNKTGLIYSPGVDQCVNGLVLFLGHQLCMPGAYYTHPTGVPIVFNPAVDTCRNGMVVQKGWDACPRLSEAGISATPYDLSDSYCFRGDVRPLTYDDRSKAEAALASALRKPADQIQADDEFRPSSLARPPGRSPSELLASIQPLPEISFRLGALARMVEYGYIDDAVIEVSQASIRKLDELQTLYSNAKFNDYIRRQLAIGASQFEGARLAHLQKTILAKQMFLAENKLTIEPLDASVRQVENRMKRQFPAFKLEVLRHEADGSYYLIFRTGEDSVDMFRKIFKDPIPHKMERQAYDLANNMVGDFLKLHPDKKVLLLGHDFGGAIAQYVATMQSMDAITFNSFRISIDIKNDTQPSRGKVLMYAAVYPREEIVSGRRQSEVGFFPDPVSIKHSISVTGSKVSAPTSLSFAALTMRNEREHLVRPTCLFVQPDPFYDETDRSILYQDFWAAAFSPALFSPTQIAEAVGSFAVFSSVASRMVEDLRWPTAGTTQFDLDVKANFQRALFDDAARKATLTSGFLGALHVISDVERRKYGKVAMTIASKSAVKRFINFYRRSLMAHSMERFVRGLHSTDKNAGMLNLLDSTIVVPPAECGKKLF